MVSGYRLIFTKQAQKDAKKLSQSGLRPNAETVLQIVSKNPYQTPPSFEDLVGDLQGAYSRRINIQHRLVYSVQEDERIVKILRMWTHHE